MGGLAEQVRRLVEAGHAGSPPPPPLFRLMFDFAQRRWDPPIHHRCSRPSLVVFAPESRRVLSRSGDAAAPGRRPPPLARSLRARVRPP